MEGYDFFGIDVGFLVCIDWVKVFLVCQLVVDEIWDDNGQTVYIYDYLLLLLIVQVGLMWFQVIVVYIKVCQNVDKIGSFVDCDCVKCFEQVKLIVCQVQVLQQSLLLILLMVVGDFNVYQFSDGFVDMVGLILGCYKDSENLFKFGGFNIVYLVLWNVVDLVLYNDCYLFQFMQNFGEIQGYIKVGLGNFGCLVFIFQVFDYVLLSWLVCLCFMCMQYGCGNLDVLVQMLDDVVLVIDVSKVIGVFDYDGFVVELFDLLIVIGYGYYGYDVLFYSYGYVIY